MSGLKWIRSTAIVLLILSVITIILYFNKSNFSKEEIIFMEENQDEVFYVAVSPYINESSYFIDADGGKGYLKNFLEIIERDLGLTLKLRDKTIWNHTDYLEVFEEDNTLVFDMNIDCMKDNLTCFTFGIDKYDNYTSREMFATDVPDLKNSNVGVLRGDLVINYLHYNYGYDFFNIMIFNSPEEVLEAQLRGKTDSYFMCNSMENTNNGITRQFSLEDFATSYRISSLIENKILIGILEKQVEVIEKSGELSEILLESKLDYIKSKLELTEDELDYLSNIAYLEIVINENLIPIEYFVHNELHGLTQNVMQKLASVLELEVKYIDYNELEIIRVNVETLPNKGVKIYGNKEITDDKDLVFTNPIRKNNYVFVDLSDSDGNFVRGRLYDKAIGVLKDDWIINYMETVYNNDVIEFDNYDDALKGLDNHEIDYLLMLEESLLGTQINNWRPSVSEVGTLPLEINIGIAAEVKDATMISIINKVLPYLDIEVEMQLALGAVEPEFDYLTFIELICFMLVAGIILTMYFKAITARKNAEESTLKKDNFIARISHEIRTPLNAIIGYTGLMKNTNEKDTNEYLKIIESSSEILLDLVNDVVDLAKVDANSMTIERDNIDLQGEIIKLMKTLVIFAEEKGIKLICNFQDVPEVISGDILRIRQVLINFVYNCIKFTDKGYVNLLVKCVKEEKRYNIKFELKDTGIGIAKENIKSLFNPFDQLQPSISRLYGGSGLGLSIAKKLVTCMGGNIEVTSELGVGSQFNFNIITYPALEVVKKEVVISSDINITHLSILLVEDNLVNQTLVVEILKSKGNKNVTVADNGQEALNLLDLHEYDVILMDINMPILDGVATTKAVRKKFPNRNHKIIALTANVMKDDLNMYLKNGFDDTINKPIHIDLLIKKILK